MFSSELHNIFKDTNFHRTPPMDASKNIVLIKNY